jgi:hypothetical protein
MLLLVLVLALLLLQLPLPRPDLMWAAFVLPLVAKCPPLSSAPAQQP